jgi:hypothetical protein
VSNAVLKITSRGFPETSETPLKPLKVLVPVVSSFFKMGVASHYFPKILDPTPLPVGYSS